MTLDAPTLGALGVIFAIIVKGYLDIKNQHEARTERLADAAEARTARERLQATADAIKHDTDGNLAAARVEIAEAKKEIQSAKAELANQTTAALTVIQQQVAALTARAVAAEERRVPRR